MTTKVYTVQHLGYPTTEAIRPEQWKTYSTHKTESAAWKRIKKARAHLEYGSWDDHYRVIAPDGTECRYRPYNDQDNPNQLTALSDPGNLQPETKWKDNLMATNFTQQDFTTASRTILQRDLFRAGIASICPSEADIDKSLSLLLAFKKFTKEYDYNVMEEDSEMLLDEFNQYSEL